MCVSSTLRSGVNSATNIAQMTRLSANKWNGHTATIGSFLRALVRFQSEIPAVIQLCVTLGTSRCWGSEPKCKRSFFLKTDFL